MPLIKYSIFKNSAIAAENEVINDSIGSVSFITKAQAKINLANLSNKENKELKTPRNQSFVDTKDLETNNTDCFYKHFSERSVYKDEKTKETITPPSSNVYKIQLEDNTIFALEIRNNDPLYIIGLDISTYLILQSIAVSTAEIETIKTLIENNNFPKSPTYYFLYGNIVTVENNGERPYYKVNLGISGSEVNTVTGKNQVQQLDTGIVLYSFDKNNWISSDYAEAAFNIITGYVWDNKIIPNPIEVNPFAAYWTGENGLKERLNTIITEANNLPIANDNKGARLLDTPIRDYIYQGDIEKVTFEMAFRLPFYMEDIKKTPYTKLTNGRDNNPYYTKFDDWFGYANGLRTSAGKTLLNEAGKITTNYNDDYHDYNKEFQDLLIVKPQNKREYYVQKLVSAFIAKNFEYENANYIDIAHIPYPQGSIKKQGGARDLTVLVNSAIISQDTKTKLENESIKYAKITDGTYTGEEITNAYVSKSKGSFYIYTYTWNETTNKPNSSGLTFGFGYDIGQNKSLDNFNDYTGFDITSNSGIKYTAIMNALGSTRINAMHNYFTYYDSVWKGLHISFERAVEKTIPKMKGAGYLEGAIKLLAKNHIKNNVKTSELFLRIFQPYFGYFYNEGKNNQFLNEVEKVFLLSLSWNKGNGSVNQNQPKEYLQNIAKRAIHTFNTHDYRYLAYAIKESQISHRQKILDFIKDNNVFIYCTNPSKK